MVEFNLLSFLCIGMSVIAHEINLNLIVASELKFNLFLSPEATYIQEIVRDMGKQICLALFFDLVLIGLVRWLTLVWYLSDW